MFAAIFVPKFQLQAMVRHEPALRGEPVALLSNSLPPLVREVSAEAERHGIHRGMSGAQAGGRCPELHLRIPGDRILEPARDCLLQCAGTLSPWVEATAEGIATVEWREWQQGTTNPAESPGAYLRTALERVVGWLEEVGLTATAGAGENPDLAILAARCAQPVLVLRGSGGDFLSPLPVEILAEIAGPLPEGRQVERDRALRILRRWGVRTLGQLAALQRAHVVERLGAEAGVLWAQAAGCSVRLLQLVRVPERFVEAHEFEQEVETLEPLMFILRRFVEQLSVRLVAVHRVAAVLQLELRFARNVPHLRELKVPSPTAEVAVLYRMLETHLENVSAQSPVQSVRLEAVPTAQQRSQFHLFSSRLRDPNQFYETLARLTALLGAERVGSPVLLDSHRPDAFRIEVPRFDAEELAITAESLRALGLPLRRFRPPAEATVEVVDRRPVYLESRPVRGLIEAVQGPWLSAGEWWTADAWKRVEWDVQLAAGVYRLVKTRAGFYVEGCYD